MTNSRLNSGAILTPEQVATLIVQPTLNLTQARSVSTVVATSSATYRVPIVVSDPATGWVKEAEEIPLADAALSEVVISPSKLAGLAVVSNELASDSTPAAAQTIGDGLARDLARKVDQAYFGNLPSPAPTGLSGLSGITTLDVSKSGIVNLDVFAQAMSTAAVLGTAVSAFVASPQDALILAQLKQGSTSNVALLQPDPTMPTRSLISGTPLVVSAAVPAGTIWAIPRDQAVMVVREDAQITTDSSAFFTSDRTAIRAILRVGFGFTQPAAITKIITSAPAKTN